MLCADREFPGCYSCRRTTIVVPRPPLTGLDPRQFLFTGCLFVCGALRGRLSVFPPFSSKALSSFSSFPLKIRKGYFCGVSPPLTCRYRETERGLIFSPSQILPLRTNRPFGYRLFFGAGEDSLFLAISCLSIPFRMRVLAQAANTRWPAPFFPFLRKNSFLDVRIKRVMLLASGNFPQPFLNHVPPPSLLATR